MPTETIVVGVDYSDTSALALKRALAIAGATGAEVHVALSAPAAADGLIWVEGDNQGVTKTAREALDDLVGHVERVTGVMQSRNESLPERPIVSHLLIGRAAENLADLASKLDADWLVVGTHGRRGLKRLLLGSVAERLLRIAPCPVLVVRPKESEQVAPDVPRIEPACPKCVAKRRETKGERLFCDEHEHGSTVRPHRYHVVPRNVRARENEPLLIPQNPRS